MKHYYSLIIALCAAQIINTNVNAQFGTYGIINIPDNLKANADEIVRKHEVLFDIHDAKNATLRVKKVITLFNDHSNESVQAVYYDKDSKITRLTARIYDAFGKEIRKVKSKEFLDQAAVPNGTIYSDSRVKHTELIHNSYPYTVELEYEKTYKKVPFYKSAYLQSYRTSVQSFTFIVQARASIPIQHRAHNIVLEPTVQEQNGNITYTWKADNLPALIWEPYAPYIDQIRPAILIAPHQFQYNNYKGSMTSWKSFGRFMYDINKGRDQLSPEMAQKVRELVKDKENNLEKIQVLYNYLQQNMRYVSVQLGIGGWQTFDAAYVEKNKYGDCKALSNFMKSMLNEIGIESNWVLIYNGENNKPTLLEDMVTPGSANHMIVNVPSEDLYLECTSSNYPMGYLGGSNHNRQVLLVTNQGGILSRTPKYDLNKNKTVNITKLVVNEKGSTTIKQQSQYHGPSHDWYRAISNHYSMDDIKKFYLRSTDLPAFDIDHLAITNDEDAPRSVIDFHATVPRYASKAGKRIFLPLNKLNPFTSVPKVIEDRKHPIHVKKEYSEEDVYTFELPSGYAIESIPSQQIDLDSEFGHYKVDISIDGNILIYKRMLEIYSVELPAERYEDLRRFYKEIAKADIMKVVLVQKRT